MREIGLIVVEDDPIQQGIYLECFRGLDLQISFCNTVSLAVGLSSLMAADAIIVDLGLPDGDGVEAIKEIIKQSDEPAPHIVVVTGSTNKSEHQRALDAGADSVLVKPISEDQIKGALRTVFDTE